MIGVKENKMEKILQQKKSLLKKIYDSFFKLINKKDIDSINIGGGPNFKANGWLNLEEVKSSDNPYPFKLTKDCVFPVADSSMKVAYTSHCLEHLENKIIYQVFSEVNRVLKEDGSFIIKLPDFDKILESWKKRDNTLLGDNLWSFETITHTWENRGIKDCLDYRAAMIFCSFWTKEYGDPYTEEIFKNKLAYHGPPITSIDFLNKLIEKCTPSQISAELCKVVIKNEKNYNFNHRNAWSREELRALLNLFGFYVESFDKDFITHKYKNIPGIKKLEKQSMYCLAKKKI